MINFIFYTSKRTAKIVAFLKQPTLLKTYIFSASFHKVTMMNVATMTKVFETPSNIATYVIQW